MIQENDYILLKKGDFLKVFQVKPNKPIIIDRYKVKLNSLIGKPFGLQYEIKDQHFHLLVKNNHTVEDNMEKIDVVKDNRNIIDNILNQKLSKDDIEKLKLNEEISGKKIINCLIENSSSFNNKTEYSQEKYIRKKEGKYLPIYQVLRPTIRTLCHFYTQGNNKRKILNIRIDSLSQLLSYSNVSSSKNVMVVESCKGLLLAATIERLAGKGTIVNLTPNGSYIYTKDILDYMNFPNNYTKNIFHFPLERMDKIKEYINELNTKLSSTSDNFYIRKLEEKLKVALIVNDLLEKKNIDCLIIASKFQPKSILERAIKYMDSNRNFALYSSIQENLVECHTFLKKSQKALNIEITECFLREYQILPERTHPKVMMDSCSGFLLTGWTIEKNNEK